MNNDAMLYDYLLQMGAMRPEQDELKRKQAMIDALRGNVLTPDKGEMIGKHYVGPGIGGALAKMGQAYFANQGQAGVDEKSRQMNANQARALAEMRKRWMGGGSSDIDMMGWGNM